MHSLAPFGECCRVLLAKLDEAFAELSAAQPGKVTCAPGCDNCCTHPFDIRLVEALEVCRGVKDLPAELRRTVMERAESARVEIAEAVGARAGLERASRAETDERVRVMKTLTVPCPLLSDGRCGAYEHRAGMCRIFGAPFAMDEGDPILVCPYSGFTEADKPRAALVGRIFRALDELDAELVKSVTGVRPGGPIRMSIAAAVATDYDDAKAAVLARAFVGGGGAGAARA